MPAVRGRPRERPPREEVRRRWDALSPPRRQAVLRFEDPALLGKVREALATLYERQSAMSALGLVAGDSGDPLEASVLLKEGFEFSWTAARSKKDPSVVMLDPGMQPILVAKGDFVRQDDLLERMSSVLPDFLAERGPRQPAPRARWKEIWTAEPANVVEMERQLARLVEQALWAMVSDPTFQVEKSPVQDTTAQVELDPWMEEHDARVKKSAERQRRRKVRAAPALLALVAEDPPVEPEVLASHYWRGEVRRDELQERDRCGAAAHGAPAASPEEEAAWVGTSSSGVALAASAAAAPAPSGSRCTPAAATPTPVGEESEGDGSIIFGSYGCPSSSRPSTPAAQQVAADWQPNQVVQYIWGQLSQDRCAPGPPPEPGATAIRGLSGTSTADTTARNASPRRRGEWLRSNSATPLSESEGLEGPSFRVVVRNTFIDTECATPSSETSRGSRASRSLSPSLLRPERRMHLLEGDGGLAFPEQEGRGTTHCEEGDTWYWYSWR